MSGNRRILSVVVLMLGLALAFGASAGANAITPPPLSSNGVAATPGELAIVRAMNAVRANNGVPALRVGRRLTRAARSHSVDMARRGYFDHGAFVERLRSFGVRAPYLGENLASGTQPLGGRDRPDVDREPAAPPEPARPGLPAHRRRHGRRLDQARHRGFRGQIGLTRRRASGAAPRGAPASGPDSLRARRAPAGSRRAARARAG